METLNECRLKDLGFEGEKYTWEKSRGHANWTQERLDRGVANQGWCELFPNAVVQHQIIYYFFSSYINRFIYQGRNVLNMRMSGSKSRNAET